MLQFSKYINVLVILYFLILYQSSCKVIDEESLISNKQMLRSRIRCGGKRHSDLTRPCLSNDTVCGSWKDGYFHPSMGCYYQDISQEQALKCLSNKTIAFIGDSQIRDIAMGLIFLAMGLQPHIDINQKFDKSNADYTHYFTFLGDVPSWRRNQGRNGFYSPTKILQEIHRYQFQIQFWSLYNGMYMQLYLEDVLNDVAENDTLHNIDIAFVNHGIHNIGWWDDSEGRVFGTYGETFYQKMFSQWSKIKDKVKVPSIWTSLNPNCENKLESQHKIQQIMADEANYYINQKTKKLKIPYWDSAAVLRGSHRCNISADGLHVKVWVEIMRAKMLLNHLCDSHFNWRGNKDNFI